MNLARQINEKLDQILDIKSEIERINAEVDDDAVLTNIVTGEKQNKEDALKLIDKILDDIKSDLNKITNNGLNVNEIFTNNYYVNDFSQDKRPLPYPPGFCEVDEIKSPIKKSTKIKPPDLNNWGKYDGDAF